MAGGNSGHNKIYRRKQFRSRTHRKKHNVHSNHSPNPGSPHQVDQSMTSTTSGVGPPTGNSASSTVVTRPRTLAFENLAITSGLGYDLLRKAGWKPGQRLGPGSSEFVENPGPAMSAAFVNSTSPSESSTSDSDAGLSVPLPIVIRHNRAGVGASGDASVPLSSTTTPPSTKTANTNKFNNHKRAHMRSRKNYNRQSKSRFIKRDSHNDMVDNSEDEHFGSIRVPRSHASPSKDDISASPTSIVSHMAKLDIFDPLCPHCPYDSNHVVRDLKALRKHVKNCPANPDRAVSRHSSGSSGGIASPSEVTPQGVSLEDIDALSYSSFESPNIGSSTSIDSEPDSTSRILQCSLSFRRESMDNSQLNTVAIDRL